MRKEELDLQRNYTVGDIFQSNRRFHEEEVARNEPIRTSLTKGTKMCHKNISDGDGRSGVRARDGEMNITADCPAEGVGLRVTLLAAYALFFPIGLLGNALALWVFLRSRVKNNSVRVFLTNLAVADLLLAACLPFRVAYHWSGDRWLMPAPLCRLVGNVFYMNMYISIVLLGLISVDRYLRFHRLPSRKLFQQRWWNLLLCGVLWAGSIAAVTPYVLLGADSGLECFQYRSLTDARWQGYFNFVIVGLFWLVCGALMVSYGRIGAKLLRVARDKPDFPNAARYHSTAWKSFFVLFLFTLCFVPYHLVRIFYVRSQMTSDSGCGPTGIYTANEAVLLLAAFNSCLDPVMYFLLCGSIRRTTLKIIQKKSPGPNSSDDTPQNRQDTAGSKSSSL